MNEMLTQTTDYIKQIFSASNRANSRRQRMFNPIYSPAREDAGDVKICVYEYDGKDIQIQQFASIEDTFRCKETTCICWINIDGIRKEDVTKICHHFSVHPLIEEDILSVGQRPKMDEVDDIMYCLLNMLYFNEKAITVEQEQISIILGRGFVITFQDDASRDVFNQLRDKLKMNGSKIRNANADYLAYSLIDTIVDHYFIVMDKLSERIEAIEDEIIHGESTDSLAHANRLRKELIVLRRNILPVRDLVSSVIRSDSELLNEKVMRYFKDIHDHIMLAADMVENYRDMMMNMQDLYLNKANIKMNEVMKLLAIVTCLMAPATVIGGIFGMNFDRIPYLHNQYGFWIAVGLMTFIPVYMIVAFKKRGWFTKM